MTDYKKVFESFQEDFGLLIQAGFVAIQQLDEPGARKLFEAAKLLRPESSAPDIGFGYIHLNKMEHQKANEIFCEIVTKEPENHLAQVFYGMTMMMNEETQKDGEAVVSKAIAKTDDQAVVNLGKAALEWSSNDLKREKAPFFEGSSSK